MAELQRLLDGVVDEALFLLDEDGRVRSWNEGGRRLTGHDDADVLGQPLGALYADGAAAPRDLDWARADGRWEGEGWRVRRDGSRIWTAAALTRLDDGGFAGRLRAAAEPGTDPLAAVAHDLRSPLGVLAAHVELLLHRWDRLDDDGRREHLAAIARAGERAVATLDGVLERER